MNQSESNLHKSNGHIVSNPRLFRLKKKEILVLFKCCVMILKEIIINCRNSLRNTTAVLKLLTNQTCRMGLASSKFSTSNLSSPQAKMIQQLISENCVVVFSKTTCPYCTQTKQMLNGMRVPYRAIELNQHPDGAEMQNVLASMTDAKTVPRVFINGDCVGRASDMKNLYRNGQLIKLVEQCISK